MVVDRTCYMFFEVSLSYVVFFFSVYDVVALVVVADGCGSCVSRAAKIKK